MSDSRRLLLLSSSTVHGREYLAHAEGEIREFLGNVSRVLFVPFALHDRAAYARRVGERFAQLGYGLESLHAAEDMRGAVQKAEAIFIGGGNTFRLLKSLHDSDLLGPIAERVSNGMPYMGASAGSNVAGPTIRTTNDMPIVQPPSFEALRLVSFQINPHYLDADPSSTHMGETREERIAQFLEENETPVLGLREASVARVENGTVVVKGAPGARLFRRGIEPIEINDGTDITELVGTVEF